MSRIMTGSRREGVRPMRIRFDGKTVVVSGVGHGFGRCIAETFAQIGARVFGCDLSAAELAETAKTGVDTQVLDLTDRAAAAAWIVEIERATGGAVDVLVNNSGGVAGQEMRPIEEVPDADWDHLFAVNLDYELYVSVRRRNNPPRQPWYYDAHPARRCELDDGGTWHRAFRADQPGVEGSWLTTVRVADLG